ncbi:hypothetical protein Fcan01_22672 [Folsomia candida]|uniref:Uncharacterized protein n=1 Tax=Folsomia candida TaxID=158441 RepID=A0A226DCK4_FOLCA|nr:hypothetical protein Fcan01_22672 [Folsomia candida]
MNLLHYILQLFCQTAMSTANKKFHNNDACYSGNNPFLNSIQIADCDWTLILQGLDTPSLDGSLTCMDLTMSCKVFLYSSSNIYYHGGLGRADVFKFSPSLHTVENVTILPFPNSESAAVQVSPSSPEVLIPGGNSSRNGRVRFNMDTLETQELPPFSPHKLHVHPGRVGWPRERLNFWKSLQTEEIGGPTFPSVRGTEAAVWDGSYVYVVGGYGGLIGGNRSDSILTWSPERMEHSIIPILNHFNP